MRINFNPDVIIQNRQKANRKNLEIFAQTILDDSNFYLPRDQDELLNSSDARVDADNHATVGWYSVKARFLYKGQPMVGRESRSAWAKAGETKVVVPGELQYSKDKNPNAQKEWFEVAKKAKQGWAKLAQKLFGGG